MNLNYYYIISFQGMKGARGIRGLTVRNENPVKPLGGISFVLSNLSLLLFFFRYGVWVPY
jgi:hypothetical protein